MNLRGFLPTQSKDHRKLIHCYAGVSRTGLVFTLLNIVAYLSDLKRPLQSLNVPELILMLNESLYAMVNMKNTERLKFIQDWTTN